MPLVLHGGSGIPKDQIVKAVELGISKVNVNTENQVAFANATRAYIESGADQIGKGYDPRKLLAPGRRPSLMLLHHGFGSRLQLLNN